MLTASGIVDPSLKRRLGGMVWFSEGVVASCALRPEKSPSSFLLKHEGGERSNGDRTTRIAGQISLSQFSDRPSVPAQVVALDECDPATFNAANAVGPGFCKNVALGASTQCSTLFAEAQKGNPDKNWDFEPDTITVDEGTDRLVDGKLFLYTQKTGQHVYVPLPAFVAAELENTPRASDRHWFWNGRGTVETARKKWTASLTELFEDAKIEGGHAHRFRDTMAIELLKAGTPIESVSILMGHSSARITEKHYNPWNKARQEQAEADVARSWATDPIVLLETAESEKCLKNVQGGVGRPN
jgi:hypothetical protein